MNAPLSSMGRSPRRAVIVGGGFTGYAAAIALMRRLGALDLTIIDAASSRGAGLAYGAAIDAHLLNIRVRDLELAHDDGETFHDWLIGQGHEVTPEDFVPRRLIAGFVSSVFERAQRQFPACQVKVLNALAERIDLARIRQPYLVTAGGAGLRADDVLVATGYGPEPRVRFGLSPFGSWPELRVRTARRAIIAGAGLSMLDALQRLEAYGFEGMVTVISRHGLAPLAHAQVHADPVAGVLTGAETPLEALRAVRRAVGHHDCWQSVINCVRPMVQTLWMSWDGRQRQSFLRHLRSFWDKARHRAAPQSLEAFQRLKDEGRLEIRSGHVAKVSTTLTGWEVWLEAPEGNRAACEKADLVIDCTGHSPASVLDLIAPVIQQGLVRMEPYGPYPSVTPAGQVCSPGGGVLAGLHILGPAAMGSLFEITAIREIWRQAELAAETVEARADPV